MKVGYGVPWRPRGYPPVGPISHRGRFLTHHHFSSVAGIRGLGVKYLPIQNRGGIAASDSQVLSPPETLGQRLRQSRQARGLTLRDVAQETGFSVSFLSQVERGTSSLTLSSLSRIADALAVPVTRLFDPPPLTAEMSRRGSRTPFHLEFSPITYYRLGAESRTAHMNSLLIELPPHTSPSPEAFRHPGEEFAYILSGALLLTLADEEYRLEEGDAIQFSGDQVHNWANPGSVPMRAVWVTTEHLFGSHTQ